MTLAEITPVRPSLALVAIALSLSLGCANVDGEGDDDADSEEPELGTLSSEIVGGTATTGYAGVGMVYFTGKYVCTGFLVSPKVVVTAAHCFDGGRTPTAFYTGDGAAVSSPSQVPSIANLTKHAVKSWKKHPSALTTTSPARYDVATVVLRTATTGALKMGNPPASSTRCRLVGYGLNGVNQGTGTGGLKRVGATTIAPPYTLGPGRDYSIVTITQPTFASNGDSGGPMICDGAAVGVFSWLWWDGSGRIYRNSYTGLDRDMGTWVRGVVAANP